MVNEPLLVLLPPYIPPIHLPKSRHSRNLAATIRAIQQQPELAGFN